MAPPRWLSLWDSLLVVNCTFQNIPTLEIPWVGVFVPAGTLIAVNLLRAVYPYGCTYVPTFLLGFVLG